MADPIHGGVSPSRSIPMAGFALAAVLLLGPWATAADRPPLWGGLTPGPCAVGFRSTWELDYSRTYRTTFDDGATYAAGKAPRPILINVWYPAEPAGDRGPMPHGGYFEVGTADPRLAKLASRLAEYERGVVGKELFGEEAGAPGGRERRLLERLWATPTACTRDARPLGRKGPVVVYHCGAQSSFEDNAVLCEYLASHGYVVLGGEFQHASGATLNIDGQEGSARDFAFLIAYASRLPFADWEHVAVAGHSAGAQAALLYASRGATPVDAVVSLDTTQDYYGLAYRGWDELVAAVRASSRSMTMPILLAANSYGIFELADLLGGSDRTYLTFRDLGHNDYISQGILRRAIGTWPDEGGIPPRHAAAPGSPEASYEALCEYVLSFLDAHLRGDAARREALDAAYRASPLGGDRPHVDHVPAGVTAAPPYRGEPGQPPGPRQVRTLLKERGLEATIEILKAAHEKAPTAPIFHETFGLSLVEELLEVRRSGDAAAFHRLYGSFDPAFRRRLVVMGKNYLRHGLKRQALRTLEKALTLDPDDAEAAAQVEALRREVGAP